MTTSAIGFCSRCGLIRQDDAHGWPVTPCACFIEHHAQDCRLRIAIRAPIAIPCDEHRADSCPVCFSCTCGVEPERMFVCGQHEFEWEDGVGLMPTRATVERVHAARKSAP